MIIEYEYCASFIYDNCKNTGYFYGTRDECTSFLSEMGYNIGNRETAVKIVRQYNGEPMMLKAIMFECNQGYIAKDKPTAAPFMTADTVREIVRDEMHKQVKEAAMSRAQ